MDFIFKVDPIRRNIKVPDGFTVLTMDHNVHKLVFVCPYYEDFAFDSASIVFMVDAPDGRQYIIPAEEYESFPNSPAPYVKFTLTLKSYITSVVGYMSFCITADIISSGNVIEKSWHSKNISISIGGHIDNDDSEDIPEEDVPTINQRLNNLDSKVGRLQTTVNGIANGSPTPVETVAEMTDESAVYLYTGSETGYTAGNWYFWNGSVWTSGGTYGGAVTDTTLSISGKPADAKAVGDALAEKAEQINALGTRVTGVEGDVSDLKEDLNRTEDEIIRTAGVIEELECGLTEEVKTALLACFTRVAWIGDDGQTYYDALSDALNRSRVISGISAVFTQGSAVIYDTDELYALKQYLTVTATYSDGTTKEVNNYTLIGKLVAGTSTITVAYNKKTTTFNVTVTHQTKTLESISATFNSSASITTDNVLDDLRPYLTVRALYNDGTTETVRNYTLSGNLNAGTNTITVTYSGKTATFTVNVTEAEVVLQSITANFNQGSAVIYTDNTLNDLKPYLTVIARYSNGTTQTVTNYTLSGTLTKGISVITASYSGKTATFNVNVTEESADVSKIKDSWDTIIANIDNGTYSAKYKVGNYIPIDLGTEGIVNMQIVAKDADELADGSGYAPVTLLAMKGIVTEKSWNQISSYINSDVKALIPEKIRNRISPVKKYTVENNNANYLTTENLWIPSAKEVSAKSFGFSYETEGVEYDKIFKDNSSRRLKNGAWYWLRSKASINSSNRQYVADGDVGQSAVTATMAIRLGFCIGKSIVYSLPRTTIFNGISDYIDTGIQLAKDDTPFTIQYDIMDQLPQESVVYGQTTLYHCMHESEPYPGYSHVIQRDNVDNKSLGFSFNGTVSNYDNVINYNSYSTNKRIRTVITKKSDGTISIKSKEENGTIQVITTTIPEFVSVSETLLIGAYRTTDNVKGRFWKGIMYDFKIYNRAISDDEATAYLQEDYS